MFLNPVFQRLRQSPTVALNDRITARRRAGEAVVPLHVGDPDFDTPAPILQVALKSLQSGHTHYAPSNGLPELRQAVTFKLQRDNGLSYDPDAEVLITHGGVHAYFLALLSILTPGDDVLIPDPSWATHANVVTMLGGNAIRVPAFAENNFLPEFTAWQQALTAHTRAIVVNYPSNPTGVFPTLDYYQQLQEFAAAHHLWIVSDEVYESLYFTPQRPPSAASPAGAKERTILVHSLSKTYAMTGWRVGYLAAPVRVIEHVLKGGQNTITCLAPFIQQAAAFALTDPDVQEMVAQMREAYARRRALVLRIADERWGNSLRLTPPMGAFYFFLDLRFLGLSSLQVCERLLDEAGVGLVPGSAFGAQGEGFARLCIAASEKDLEIGLRKIFAWVAENFAN